ncbi:MAG: polyphosphate kinase 2 family protein [Oscillospiraceae bacterium]|nr:polyphosphate kinase 2 family protein [Oscillospiraceae bacterium]
MYNIKDMTFDEDNKINLSDLPCQPDNITESKEEIQNRMEDNLKEINKYQDKLYAGKTEGVIILLQGMDAAGKDGLVSHVMGGINPQGVDVYSFKSPSAEELAHDYLWRIMPCIPERGKIAIFNRSYYEDVLVVKVHKLYLNQNLPARCLDDIFEARYKQINHFEKYLWENGIRIVKIFLHLSKDEQKKRLLSRINDESKNWKLSMADVKERGFWDDYQSAYQDAINATASHCAPWHIIPADKKPVARLIASEIILRTLKDIDPKYPKLSDDMRKEIKECENTLKSEK